jgi:hypothetical protein
MRWSEKSKFNLSFRADICDLLALQIRNGAAVEPATGVHLAIGSDILTSSRPQVLEVLYSSSTMTPIPKEELCYLSVKRPW